MGATVTFPSNGPTSGGHLAVPDEGRKGSARRRTPTLFRTPLR